MAKKQSGQTRTKYGIRESDVRVVEAYSLPEGLRDKIRAQAKAKRISRSALAAELLRAGLESAVAARSKRPAAERLPGGGAE